MTRRLGAVFAMECGLVEQLFTVSTLNRLARVATFDARLVVDEVTAPGARQALEDAEVLITGWGSPRLTREVLDRMPRLRAVVHAAGSVKYHLPDEFWAAGIPVSSAADANSIPVAEFTVASILFANKNVLEIARRYRVERTSIDWRAAYPSIGNVGKRVGLVGFSRIGQRVAALLAPFDLEVVVADPVVDPDEVAAAGARLVGLDELVATSDVVSLHAPALPETEHLLDARRLALMRPGATLINTARGSLVDLDALTEAVVEGRVKVVLDVTDPDPLPADSPLYDHEDALLTPHIAGSFGTELRRLGAAAVDEVERLARGDDLAHPVLEGQLRLRA